jgi:hypothetical protein
VGLARWDSASTPRALAASRFFFAARVQRSTSFEVVWPHVLDLNRGALNFLKLRMIFFPSLEDLNFPI